MMVSNPNPSNWLCQIPGHATKIGIAAVFFVVLLGMSGLTWQTLTVLAAPNPSTEFVIEVVDRRWEEVSYPGQTVSGDIHAPLDQPVTLSVSNFYGKVAPIWGYANTIWVETDSPGVYGGRCAEFCVIRHARMSFGTIAAPEEISSKGRQHQCHPAVVPVDSEAPDNL